LLLLLLLLWLRLRAWCWLRVPHRTRIFPGLRLLPWLRRSLAALLLRRCDAFALRLLLSHRTSSAFCLRCGRPLDSLLLPLRLFLLLLLATRFTLLRTSVSSRLFASCFFASWLFDRMSWLRLRRRLCWWRASILTGLILTSLTLIAHLELLSLRALGRLIDAHRLGQIRPEPR
jgi:hypothetical protein